MIESAHVGAQPAPEADCSAGKTVTTARVTYPLTVKQRVLFEFLCEFIAEHDLVPSFRQMMAGVGLNSTSGVHRLLEALEERGFIRRLPNRARAIELVEQPGLMRPLSGWPTAVLVQELKRRGLRIEPPG